MKMLMMGAVTALLGGGVARAAEPQDAMFVNQAAVGGIAEVQAGQLAQTKAGAPAIRDFAAKMVADHTGNNQQLMALAAQKGLTPPTTPDARHQAEFAALQAMPGTIFDAAYVRNQVAGHQDMAAVMQQEIQSGSDPDLKAFAAQTLPVVQMHLQLAQKLAGGTTQ